MAAAKRKVQTEPQVKAGVGVIVCKGLKVLAGERCGSHGAGRKAFPGGHLEANDTKTPHALGGLGVCAEREVLEETGIICRAFSPDHVRSDLFTTFDILSDDGQKVYVTPYIIAEYVHGGIELPDGSIKPLEPHKCVRWDWMSLDEVAKLIYSPEDKIWIPVPQVLYYLKKHWGLL